VVIIDVDDLAISKKVKESGRWKLEVGTEQIKTNCFSFGSIQQ